MGPEASDPQILDPRRPSPRCLFQLLCGGLVFSWFFRFLVLGPRRPSTRFFPPHCFAVVSCFSGSPAFCCWAACLTTYQRSDEKTSGYRNEYTAWAAYRYERNVIPSSSPPPQPNPRESGVRTGLGVTLFPDVYPPLGPCDISLYRIGDANRSGAVRRLPLTTPHVLPGMEVAQFLPHIRIDILLQHGA